MMGQENIHSFAETNCWVNGTFTIRNVTKSESQVNRHATIRLKILFFSFHLVVNGRATWENVLEYQKYYQWISIILMLQAALFYIPAYLWKSWERGRISQLCNFSGSLFRK